MKRLLGSIVLMVAACVTLHAQDSTKSEIQSLIQEKNFKFIPTTVNPAGGRVRQLTTEYFIKVTPDSIIADLPYFGRAYTATIGGQNGGIVFTSTIFDYKTSPNRKDGWTIVITPKDVNDPRKISLFISSSGFTSVNVISNNRQAISYSGNIGARKVN